MIEARFAAIKEKIVKLTDLDKESKQFCLSEKGYELNDVLTNEQIKNLKVIIK